MKLGFNQDQGQYKMDIWDNANIDMSVFDEAVLFSKE